MPHHPPAEMDRRHRGPAGKRVAAAQHARVPGGCLQAGDDPAIGRRTESGGTGCDLFDRQERAERFGAADLAQVAVRQREAGQAVDALSAQKGFRHPLDRGGIAAIDQQIVPAAGGVAENGAAAVQWQDRQAGRGALALPVPAPDQRKQDQTGHFRGTPFGFEQPAGANGQENSIIQTDCEQFRRGHIPVSARPAGEPPARNANALHQKPAGLVENFRAGGKPARQHQADEVAGQNQRAQWHGDHIGRRADGGHDVEIVRDERNGAEPRGKGREQQVQQAAARHTQDVHRTTTNES